MSKVLEVKVTKRKDTLLCHHYTFGKLGDVVAGGFYIGKEVEDIPEFVIFRMPAPPEEKKVEEDHDLG